MNEPLFSERKARRPYQPEGYSEKTALENDPDQEEGLFGDEFEGDLTNDPLEDLVDHNWAIDPGEDQVVNFEDEPIVDFEDEYQREEKITNTASRREANEGNPPGNLYRGIGSDVLTMDEQDKFIEWAKGNQYNPDDPDSFSMVQPDYEAVRPILERLEEEQGLGRHWSTDYEVARGFAEESYWNFDYDDSDPQNPISPFSIVFRGDWGGEGEDFAEEHTGYDGETRPSNIPEEKEVTLHPGSEVNLVGIDLFEPGYPDFDYSMPVPDIPVYSRKKKASRVVANDGVLDSLNPTGTIFTEYRPQDRASLDLAPNIAPYSETAGVSPDDRVVVYRGVPKGVQSELADGDFITDMEQLAKDYAGYPYGDVISQEVFADEILDDLEYPMSGEYLFRPRRASKKTTNRKKAMNEDQILDLAERFEREIPKRAQGANGNLLSDLHEVAHNLASAQIVEVTMGSKTSVFHATLKDFLRNFTHNSRPGLKIPLPIQSAAQSVADNIQSGNFAEAWTILFDMGKSIAQYPTHQLTSRKKEQMSAVRNYLRFAKRRGMDPKNPRTSRSYQRSSRRLSRRAMADISSWMGAQRTAKKTAQRVLNNTRSYRRKMASGSWYLDNKLSAYVSKTPQKFACSCGSHISVPSYTNCKCGKVWNAYKIHSATKGDTTFVVREVPVRENVLVANRRVARGLQPWDRVQIRGPEGEGEWTTHEDTQVYDTYNDGGEEMVEMFYQDGLVEFPRNMVEHDYRVPRPPGTRPKDRPHFANRRRVASPREFGESYLQGQGWSSMDTGRTTWDSPSGNVSYFGNDNLVHVWNRDGDLVDDFTVDPRLAPDELAGILQETEESAARTSPWYVDNDPIEHPGADADYMHPYFN